MVETTEEALMFASLVKSGNRWIFAVAVMILSIPLLYRGPIPAEVELQVPAKPDGEMLIKPRVGGFHAPCRHHRRKVLAVSFPVAPKNQDDIAAGPFGLP